MKNCTIHPTTITSIVYFLLVALYFSPYAIAYKLTFPLAFLTLVSLRLSPWPIVMAMFFSALGDYMGVCHNFWGQMGSFALAHLAYIFFFFQRYIKDKSSKGTKWKLGITGLYGLIVGAIIISHVQGALQLGVSVYILLILSMCILAWMQKNPYYTLGAWLFVLSDTVLAWNKFVSHIGWASYLIMVPYYLGQWVLFVSSIKFKGKHS